MAAHDFTHAIVRKPARSVVAGLRAGGGPDPSFDGVASEHAAYATALIEAGLAVTILPALEEFPDSVFVEDPALVFGEGAIVLRPGAPSRAGEAAAIAPVLRDRFESVLTLDEGSVDGGDVLVTPQRVLIGLSSRTDQKGADGLTRLLEKFGRRATIVDAPGGVLHFKSACSVVDDETVLTTPSLARAGCFRGLREIVTPAGEEAAANALRVNGALFVGARFARTIDQLDAAGYRVIPLSTDEIGRLDAGLSCMSLRWRTRGERRDEAWDAG